MSDVNSLIPTVNTAIALTSSISTMVTKCKANGIITRTQIEMLRAQTSKVLADAAICHLSEITAENINQLASTQEMIDRLSKEGSLHGASLTMAMDQLSLLNDQLRQNLLDYRDQWGSYYA